MTGEIRLNAFDMNCVVHQAPGLWTHPRDRADRYNTLGYWTDLARTLERGLFDGLFLADVLGVYDVYGGSVDAALRGGVQVPVNDPLLLVPAMAQVTSNLGFGVTCTLSYEPPFTLARRLSTLDHLTQGRIGWNIVTGYLDSAAKGAGLAGQKGHDTRYEIAEEYMEVAYKLWEGSWEDGAVLRDRKRGIFALPEKVHHVRHEGQYFKVDAIHLAEPSPQRTPVLYQAGASTMGRAFAARHAECVFMSGPSPQVVAPRVSDIRRQAAAQGRDPADILVFSLLTVIPGATEEEAGARHDEYRRYVSHEAALTLVSGWTGVDLSGFRLDEPIRHVVNDAGHTALANFTTGDPRKVWTVGEVAEFAAIGGNGPVFTGSAAQVADAMEAWIEATGVDGFNLAYAVTPESFEDFVDLVVPELQRRGRYKRAYSPGTLREKLHGKGARLVEPHPATRFRDLD